MANDTAWVEDVRRWVLAGNSARDALAEPPDDGVAMGYEAAQPALQALNWPDSAAAVRGDLS
jgi:hypothetical protein